jgi:hypothetical protein
LRVVVKAEACGEEGGMMSQESHFAAVDYFSESCEPPDKRSLSVFLDKRFAAIRASERAKCVAELRAEAVRFRRTNMGRIAATWFEEASDLLASAGCAGKVEK